jgi:hypothetical protein
MSDDIQTKRVRVGRFDPRADYYVDEVSQLVVDDAIIDRGSLWDIMKPVYHGLMGTYSLEEFHRAASKFTEPQKSVYVCDRYFGEVCNGGHDQFYFNSAGMFWKELLEALRNLEMLVAASIAEASTIVFEWPPEFDCATRREQMQALPAGCFQSVDDRFFSNTGLSDDLLGYVRANRQAFYYSGTITERIGYRTETVFLMPARPTENNTES